MTDWVSLATVGRIARAHGNRGQVIVNLDTDFPEERFAPGSELFVQRGGVVERVRVVSVRIHQGRPVLGLDGVDSMNAAEDLAGLELRVPQSALKTLPPATYYHHDLVGCRVETLDGRPIGTVLEVESGAGGSRLVVQGSAGEILIPMAAAICRTVDTAAKRIVVDPPEGLLELNA